MCLSVSILSIMLAFARVKTCEFRQLKRGKNEVQKRPKFVKFTQQLGIEPDIKYMQKTGSKSDVFRYFNGRFSDATKIRDFAVPAILLTWTLLIL